MPDEELNAAAGHPCRVCGTALDAEGNCPTTGDALQGYTLAIRN
jgi:hypothetical protein